MTLKINNKHLLEGDGVKQISTPKNTARFNTGALDSIIIHYTAGPDARSSANYLAQANTKASAHLVIGRDGSVYQLVPFDTISWHAGISSYQGRKGFNNFSIGIELDNAGPLTQAGNEYIAWFGKKYAESDKVYLQHRNETEPRYWHVYTQEQIDRCMQICELLIQKYNLKMILGHEEISPGRKQDPGPAFPLDRFRDRLLSNDRKADDASEEEHPEKGTVITDKLNIRSGPGTSFENIAPALNRNTPLKILEEKNGWYKVKTEITGWVSKGFVKTE